MPGFQAESPLPELAQGALFFRLPTVMRITGLGRSTIYRLIANKEFPRPVRLGPRVVGWRRSDIDSWSAARTQANH